MTIRHAACSCGQLKVAAKGEPVRISMCHCLECQKRTGSVFGVQARWPRSQVKIEGEAAKFTRAGDSGKRVSFYFCPTCGSTLYWMYDDMADVVAVAIGNFADPDFPPPKISVYETRKHKFFAVPDSVQEHLD